jgi:hypothetical protein
MPLVFGVAIVLSSPFARGCFQSHVPHYGTNEVFPVSWGCFPDRLRLSDHSEVFPAQAGVFPSPAGAGSVAAVLPRSRGGYSNANHDKNDRFVPSPLARGCFPNRVRPSDDSEVFPANAGVFPAKPTRLVGTPSLPRSRGGGSMTSKAFGAMIDVSPLRRGCFHHNRHAAEPVVVFPARTGVFPGVRTYPATSQSLPRIRGGISGLLWPGLRLATFPARAGVFHTSSRATGPTASLPRPRGGVSVDTYVNAHDVVFPRSPGGVSFGAWCSE